ncbi:hypothetical protein [Nocardiopsis sp. CNR-923]|uniref:hypothetical protein n=1 Tax=Nocardiopsis sp. CNR-923 TaxID=1904965 RepID=UPI00373FE2C9
MKPRTNQTGTSAPSIPEQARGVRPREAEIGPEPVEVTLTVNGEPRPLRVEPRVSLLDALRERLDATGTKKGCDQGAAGPAPSWSTAAAWCPA